MDEGCAGIGCVIILVLLFVGFVLIGPMDLDGMIIGLKSMF